MAVDGAQRPLSVFSEKLVNYGIDVLRGRGAVIESGKGIDSVEPCVLKYSGRQTVVPGEVVAGTIIWTTGVRGSHVMADSGYTGKRNRNSVNRYLQDPEDSHVYLVGTSPQRLIQKVSNFCQRRPNWPWLWMKLQLRMLSRILLITN